jgi:pimeloyl-ACP methyl ester carboxylesterase
LELSYRFYPSWSDRLLIFYHGIGGDSRYICALADFVSKNNLANVLTPDFRGHGKSRMSVAQVSEPEALLNDLQDLLHHIDARYPDKELFIGGHSLGGGFALKVLCHEVLKKYFHGALTLAPYLHALFIQENGERFSSWLKIDAAKNIVELQMPKDYVSGSEVLAYDLRFFEAASLNTSLELELLKQASLLTIVASKGDLLSPAERYQKIFIDPVFRLHIMEKYSHMAMVTVPPALTEIGEILRRDFQWV